MARPRSCSWVASVGLVAALVTGCANGIGTEVAPEVDPGPPQTSSPSPNLIQPEPDPDDPLERRPVVSLPGLPIGGSAGESVDPAHPDNQCVAVNWRAGDDGTADLLAGVAVRVTGFRFTPDVFVAAVWGCDDSRVPCAGFVFTEDAQLCNLAVAPRPAAEAANPVVTLVGELDCRQVEQDVCDRFAVEVAASDNTTLGLLSLEPSTSTMTDPSTRPSDDPTGTPTEGPPEGTERPQWLPRRLAPGAGPPRAALRLTTAHPKTVIPVAASCHG